MKEFSAKLTKQAKAKRLTVKDIAFADLVACGWELNDAWFATINKGSTWPPIQLAREQNAKLNLAPIQERIDETRSLLSKQQIEKAVSAEKEKKADEGKDILAKAISKEEMLQELYKVRESIVAGSADWLKVNQQIIDVSQMKKEEVKTEDNTVHFYLPPKCHSCDYKKKAERKKGKET